MMAIYNVKAIGTILSNNDGFFVKLYKEYIPAIKELDGFSHVNIIWWFSDFDDKKYRSVLETEQPYKGAPETMGIFSTRSPIRPNPIALTVSEILHIDYQNGIIQIAYTDANDGSPLLDLKPYTPSMDRIEQPSVPSWCSHWPCSLEESADFNWENEFNF